MKLATVTAAGVALASFAWRRRPGPTSFVPRRSPRSRISPAVARPFTYGVMLELDPGETASVRLRASTRRRPLCGRLQRRRTDRQRAAADEALLRDAGRREGRDGVGREHGHRTRGPRRVPADAPLPPARRRRSHAARAPDRCRPPHPARYVLDQGPNRNDAHFGKADARGCTRPTAARHLVRPGRLSRRKPKR